MHLLLTFQHDVLFIRFISEFRYKYEILSNTSVLCLKSYLEFHLLSDFAPMDFKAELFSSASILKVGSLMLVLGLVMALLQHAVSSIGLPCLMSLSFNGSHSLLWMPRGMHWFLTFPLFAGVIERLFSG